MIKLTFKKIPRFVSYCYLIGFILVGIALLIFWQFPQLLAAVRLQQLLIVGAVIVCVGSVVNCLHQFKKKS